MLCGPWRCLSRCAKAVTLESFTPGEGGSRTALFVLHYPAFGGPHNRIVRLAEPLRRRGWEVAAVLPSERGNAADWLRGAGIDVIQTPLSRVRRGRDPRPNLRMFGQAPAEIRALRTIIRRRSPDAVVLGNLVMPHAAIAASLERRAVLWQIVDTSVPLGLQLVVMPLVAGLADCVVYGGRGLRDAHLGATRIRAPWCVISPPVDTRRFRANRAVRTAVRQEIGLGDDDPVVGQVVAINPKKGLEGFLKAAVEVLRVHPRTRFVIVGSAGEAHTSYLDELRRLQTALGLRAEQVLWLGDRSDAERFYAAMDVFVVSSVPNSEGTTTTAMEALACEVPVVATDVGAVSEVVVNGLTGVLVPPMNELALAAAIGRLLGSERERAEMGTVGRERTTAMFDVEVCADSYARAFEAALTHRAGPAAG